MTAALSPRRTALVLLFATLALLLVPLRAAQATTIDDYFWHNDTTRTNDWFTFQKRQCVSYAAWRLYRSGHRLNNATRYNGHTYVWGSAANWDDTALALHKRVTTVPRVGAIAQWNAYERSRYYANGGMGTFQAGAYGHVAYVAAVYSDGSVLVRQYNLFGTRTYSVMHVRAPRYIYTY